MAFEYDEFGLLKTEHQGWASLRYRYDEFDRLNEMVLPDGQALAYHRDTAGLLSGIDLNGQPLTRHRMASTGEEVERQQGELLSAYVYDDEGRLTQHQIHQGRLKDISAQRDYQYDPNGNLKSIQDSRKGLRQYVYDPMDRLVGVRGDLYEQLIHDPAGNLLEQNLGASSGQFANVRGNRLTMHGDSHYEYDEFGNLIEERRGKGQKLVTRYTYDCEHRLTSVTTPDGSTWHYEYDAFGRRIAKTNGLTRTEFLWQGDRLIAEETGDHYRTYLYEPDSFKPLALVDGHGPEQAEVYYYHLDHLGTPQELTSQQGRLVWSVTYRAYGNVVQQQVSEIDNPLRFQGQYHDRETGLHYNRHRYYNPNTGRFITPDPIGLAGGLNNYQYVPNPTGWVDPLGLAVEKGSCPESRSTLPISEEQIAELRATPQGQRPPPESYLPSAYIDSHLQRFAEQGGSYLVPRSALDRFGRDPVGRPDGQFMSTKSEMDRILENANGDIAVIERQLGIPEGSWSNEEIVRIDVLSPQSIGLRMPSGNESGANPLWIPGGKLPNGQSEAVVDPIPRGKYTETPIN